MEEVFPGDPGDEVTGAGLAGKLRCFLNRTVSGAGSTETPIGWITAAVPVGWGREGWGSGISSYFILEQVG
jgi:hypothetical protein